MDVNNGSSERVITFYYSNDSTDAPESVNWTLLEAVTQSGTTSIFSNTAPAQISGDGSLIGYFAGRVYSAEISKGINGTIGASPRLRGRSRGVTTFTDAQSNTWTIHGGVTIE
jgi:hypothetical protein